MTQTPTDDPVLKLLHELIERDDQNKERFSALEKSIGEVKGAQARSEVAHRELKNELQRQDSQLHLFDQRISGNYQGISAQLDVFGDELRNSNRYIGNLESAFVKLNSTSRMLHGRLIEESSIVRGRLKELDAGVLGLDDRLGIGELAITALEKRLADSEPPSVESVEAAEGG